jgi:hypothetical protein
MAQVRIGDMTKALLDKYKRAGAKVSVTHRNGVHPRVTIKIGDKEWTGSVPSTPSDSSHGFRNLKNLWESHFDALGVENVKEIIDRGVKKAWK